jgi:hypothetical protein
MTHAAQAAILGAVLLAIGSSAFGVGIARMTWADDLRRSRELRAIWDKSEKAMRSTIDSQKRTIEIQVETIAILKGR